MSLMFCGEREVVLNDTRARIALEHREDLAALAALDEAAQERLEALTRIEAHVARQLEAEGLTVHRKPWAGIDPSKTSGEAGIAYSFFNGEIVATRSGDLLWVTNGHPGGGALAAELEASVHDFLSARDIDVAFVPGEDAARLFALGGGIGCQANGLIA